MICPLSVCSHIVNLSKAELESARLQGEVEKYKVLSAEVKTSLVFGGAFFISREDIVNREDYIVKLLNSSIKINSINFTAREMIGDNDRTSGCFEIILNVLTLRKKPESLVHVSSLNR